MPCSRKSFKKDVMDKWAEYANKTYKFADTLSKIADKKLQQIPFLNELEFFNVDETKQMMSEIQNKFYKMQADINADANRLREGLNARKYMTPESRANLGRALDGSLKREDLREELQPIYDKMREYINNNANRLVEKGLLKEENKIDDYIKRVYDNRQAEKQRAKNYFTRLVARRKLSYEERVARNQIEDVAFIYPLTISEQKRQLAKGEFFESLANVFGKDEPFENAVRIENVDVGGGIKKYGALSGKWVNKEVKNMLDDMNIFKETQTGLMQMLHLYMEAIKHIKINVTVKNPVTHLYNVGSNMVMAYLNGDLTSLAKVLSMRISDPQGFKNLVERANQYGLNSFVDSLEKDMGDFNPKEELSLHNIGLKILKNIYGTKDSVTGDSLRKIYDWEDKIFKLANFKKNLDLGINEKEAFKEANEVYINYNSPIPNTWAYADRLGFAPFLNFTYKTIPSTFKVITKSPINLAKYIALHFILFELGASQFGDDDSWGLPKWAGDKINFFMAKEWVKLGESSWYINVGRALPGMKLGFWNFGSDVWNIPAGFIGSFINIANGKTPLGYNIGSKYDDALDSLAKRAENFAENFAPPFSPIGRYGQRTLATLMGKPMKNYYDQPMGVPEIMLRAIGIRNFNPGKEVVTKAKNANNKLNYVLKDPESKDKDKQKAWKEYNEVMDELKPKLPLIW